MINYLIYPSQGSLVQAYSVNASDHPSSQTPGSDNTDCENDFPPSGPTEEKCGNSGLSIVEEILHENHPEINFTASNLLYLHHIANAENIEMFHPELILPPPKM